MRLLIAILVLLLLALQYKLWFGDGGFTEIRGLELRVTAQEEENQALVQRNAELQPRSRTCANAWKRWKSAPAASSG